MDSDQHEDSEFFDIEPQQSQYELAHFDARDQEFLTRLSILSQQCNLLRSRDYSTRKENASLKQEITLLREELAPLKLLHQRVTSGYALLAVLGAILLALLEFFKGIKGLVVGK